jgi:hypothetical protein
VTRSGAGIICGGSDEIILFLKVPHLGVLVLNIDRSGCVAIDFGGNGVEKQLHGPAYISRTTKAKKIVRVFQRPPIDVGWRLFVCCSARMTAYFMTSSLLSPWQRPER